MKSLKTEFYSRVKNLPNGWDFKFILSEGLSGVFGPNKRSWIWTMYLLNHTSVNLCEKKKINIFSFMIHNKEILILYPFL